MVGNPYAGIVEFVSPYCLAKYRRKGDDDFDTLVNYFWNIALCESLYPSLYVLEISLRNAIHHAATQRYQKPYWFDLDGVLDAKLVGEVKAKRDDHAKSFKFKMPASTMIESLNLGFWTTLLSKPFHQHFWLSGNDYMLDAVFPNLPDELRLCPLVHRRYNALRQLRNRVFHFQIVMNGVKVLIDNEGERVVGLSELHRLIYDTIGWISKDACISIVAIDDFPYVWEYGREDIAVGLKETYEGAPVPSPSTVTTLTTLTERVLITRSIVEPPQDTNDLLENQT